MIPRKVVYFLFFTRFQEETRDFNEIILPIELFIDTFLLSLNTIITKVIHSCRNSAFSQNQK